RRSCAFLALSLQLANAHRSCSLARNLALPGAGGLLPRSGVACDYEGNLTLNPRQTPKTHQAL
ncbi:MAG: hypothetical protein ACPIOQ_17895, partial [Promethearchaeia archaeon]